MSDASSETKLPVAAAAKPSWRKALGDSLLGVAMWLLAMSLPQIFAALLLPTLVPALPIAGNPLVFTVYLLIELGTVALIWLFNQLFVRLSRQQLGLTEFKPNYLLQAIGGYVVYFVVSLMLLYLAASWGVNLDEKQDLGFNVPQGAELWLVGFLLMVIVPITEELLFRGFLFGILRRYLNFGWTALLVSLLFGLAHLDPTSPTQIALGIDVFALSLIMCKLREDSGSLWPTILLHALKNGVAFWLLFIYNGG